MVNKEPNPDEELDELKQDQNGLNNELMFKFAVFEEQVRQIQEQNSAIDKAIFDSNLLASGLDELKQDQNGEIFASIGRGIFIKAKLIDKNLLVDIGGKNFVKKTIPETQKIIIEQIKKLENAKEQLQENLDKINEEVDLLMKKST